MYYRNCPGCGKEISYTRKSSKIRAGKWNASCGSCSKAGRFLSEEHKKKISVSCKGKKCSEETRKRICEVRKGKKHSEETKKKIGVSRKGKKHSEETKKKIKKKRKLQVITEETKQKMRDNNSHYWAGKKLSEEHKKKMSEAQKGKILSEKTKQKIRKAMVKRLIDNNIFPNYNETACLYFDWLNKWNGWNGQHALNGGEKQVNGYFIDYFEPNLNMVIEWDEEYHYENNKLREKDIRRQKEIIRELRCTFHRIRGKDILK